MPSLSFPENALRAVFFALVLAATGCSSTPSNVDSEVTVAEADTFDEIAPVVANLNSLYGAENVLIVADIDNTLLTSATDLGGDIWYQWQRGKLAVKPTPEQQVSCLFEDTISLLYELAPMNLTEPQVPALLNNWQEAGNTLLLLTSRAPKNRAATERELLRHGIDVSQAALTPVDNTNPVYREKLEREMSYSRGLMMTTGMNKGTMLEWILNATERQFDAIVFVDDSHTNIENMDNAWQQHNTDMRIFHYTHVEAERKKLQGQVLTEVQAERMANDYAKLIATLNSIFPARQNDGQCLGQ
ncbi:MAG TPA: hypothetical protein DEP76_11815 [Alteromonas sp.]|nr:hypothetical protein [Alteromonas sp.]|tara:strand:+ start:29040 stop:29942 length:903 start_codon:yes stop_codon:yes gene_type:complete